MITNTAVRHKSTSSNTHTYQHASVRFDEHLQAALLYMNPSPRACFTSSLLKDILQFQHLVSKKVHNELESFGNSKTRYTVLASRVPQTYNLGGDLNLFIDAIERKNRGLLLDYATNCIRAAHNFSIGLDCPVTTIALVQGSAQGGGFEAALSCNVIIAERGSQMGFPEVLFNLFPGMGAYNFLSQRISPSLSERLILSGKLYTAEELYKMGVIDVLAEQGQGEQKLAEFIKESEKRSHSRDLIRYTRTKCNRVKYEELLEITELWVESALKLSQREIKTMRRLVRAQNNKSMRPAVVSIN